METPIKGDTTYDEMCMKEYRRAREKFTPFASSHEGYAVIKEELEEVNELISNFDTYFDLLWKNVKEDKFDLQKTCVQNMFMVSKMLHEELVQLGAMLYSYSQEVEEGMDRVNKSK